MSGVIRTFRIARDYKTLTLDPRSPMTGSMGSTAPAFLPHPALYDVIKQEVIVKAVRGLANEYRPYMGILYGGIIVVPDPASPYGFSVYVCEFNARWGDCEAQALLPGITNYVDLVRYAVDDRLEEIAPVEDGLFRICAVGAAKGYPDSNEYTKAAGSEIFGLQEAMQIPGVTILGAGIEVRGDRFFAKGGRLFNIVAEGENPDIVPKRINAAKRCIWMESDFLYYRQDVGLYDTQEYRRQQFLSVKA